MSRNHSSLPSSLRGACWSLPNRSFRRIQNLISAVLVQTRCKSPSAHTSKNTKTTSRGSSFFISDCSQRTSYGSRSHDPIFFVINNFVFSSSFWVVHPGFGWFHADFCVVVSSWLWVVSSWFWEFILVFVFSTDQDKQTTVIFSTKETFICHRG